MTTKRRLLWIGDAGVSTGFARCTHEIVNSVREHFDVHILALGYDGDPHPLQGQFPLYRASSASDGIGVGRTAELIGKLGPAIVVIQNDPWNIPHYLQRTGTAPVVGIIAVDGKNCRGSLLNGLQHAIFWTQFGETQARLGGYSGASTVIPLGVDLAIYRPLDKAAVRETMNMPTILKQRGLPEDTFIVGVVGRNQQRKRLDLTLEYFAHWINEYSVPDAALWIQQAPTGDRAYDLEQLGKYHRIIDRLILTAVAKDQQGVPEEVLVRVYNVFDAMISTTQGEGWGLPQMEGMACGVPQVVPKWAALEEWATAASLVRCSSTAATPAGINVLGGIPDRDEFCAALDRIYRSKKLRAEMAADGVELVNRREYRWDSIGAATTDAIRRTLHETPVVTTREVQHA
jgi:D-inositol-3-phosphate glycosyltransferase